MTDDLQQTIRRLIDRKNELPEEFAEYAFTLRQLRGLLFSWGGSSGDYRKDLDPWDWVGKDESLLQRIRLEPRWLI
jgi:hypothetical protein